MKRLLSVLFPVPSPVPFPRRVSRSRLLVALLTVTVTLAACGGGGSDDNSSNQPVSNNSPVKPAASPASPASAASGASTSSAGSASSSSSSSSPSNSSAAGNTPSGASSPSAASTPAAASTPSADTPASGTSTSGNTNHNDTPTTPTVPVNVATITVDSTLKSPTPPYNTLDSVNMPFVSVTFCVPGKQGASQCATVDHMVLDTGSVGVRVMSTALGAALAASLPAQTGASNDSTGKAAIAQCTTYVSGYMWGPTRLADVAIGGEKASSLPVQVVGDSAFTWTPSDCSSRSAHAMNTVDDLGANGVVGIGPRATDIAQAATALLAANYYYCPTPWSCTNATVPLDKQTTNPVSAFPVDNTGTIIQLPAVPATGQATVTGQLVFGIGTRENNALPANPTLTLATDSAGMFKTTYKGRTMWSAIDSGSNALFFQDSTLPALADSSWFAPATTQSLYATMISSIGNAQSTVPFSIANASTLFALGYAAYGNLGAPIPTYFLWGLPFFYGRHVYTVMSGAKVGTQTGPYVMF